MSHGASMNRSRRESLRLAAMGAGALLVLSACGAAGILGENPQVLGYEYRNGQSYVRLQSIEAGAPDNGPAYAVSSETLIRALASLRVEKAGSVGARPVFNDAELKEIAPPLAAALARAGPKQDVAFAVTGRHGALGSFSSPSITTGLVFVRDGELNVILGLIQELYDSEEYRVNLQIMPPASRTPRAGLVWKVLPGTGRRVDERPDWVRYGLPAAGTGNAAPQADSRFEEIQSRLRLLERLREGGLITEKEYEERRRAILQGI